VKQFWIFDFGFLIGDSKIKKVFCLVLGALLFALCFPVQAQQPKKVPRIGFLSPAYESSSVSEAFVGGLHELGYIEGRNITI
jgi:hypothetical protein